MSVTVYKALKHRILAGKKLYLNNAWKTIPANAKMWLNGAWHKIGSSGSQNQAVIPTPPTIPDVPAQSLTHDNGTEPSTGTIWYITPSGAGNMDGSSWANAASGSMIHVILLSCSSGDSVYFSEGDYTTDRTITLPAGVNLYGGFDADTPAWATRNGFAKQTVFTGNNTFGWMDGSSATAGQMVDGFVIKNYSSTITGSNATLRNSIVSGGTASIPTAYNCIFDSANVTAKKITYCNIFSGNLTVSGTTDVDHVNVYGTESAVKTATISYANVTNSLFYYCSLTAKAASHCDLFYGSSCTISTSAEHVNVYGTESALVVTSIANTAQYCTAVYCYHTSTIFPGGSVNCTAVNCSIDSGHIFYDNATNCTAVKCSTNLGSIFYDNATNCTAVNCSCISSMFSTATNCTAVNCSIIRSSITIGHIFDSESTNCTAVNCSCINNGYIFYNNATNCTAVNCSSSRIFRNSKNCLSWNNSGIEYNVSYITCAGSTYNAALALTLGTDNTIARFTNTGYAPAQGVQDVGDCPNPITDPTGFAAWIAAFGDWHPLANSFLVGRGTADSDVTTDADGVARPDPPTIGAYEPVPASA